MSPAALAAAAWLAAQDAGRDAAAAQADLARCVLAADPAQAARVREDLVASSVCRAVAARSAAGCAALARLPGEPETGDAMCRRLYATAMASRALVSGEPSGAACADWARLSTEPPPRDVADAFCAAAARGDEAAACAAIERWRPADPKGSSGEGRRRCGEELAALRGESAPVCLPRERPGRDVCLAAAAYRSERSGERAACAAQPLCGAMSGDAAACAALETALIKAAAEPGPAAGGCAAERARAASAVEKARAAAVALSDAQKALEARAR